MPGRASKLQFFVYILRLLAKSSPRLERWLMFGAPLVCFIRFVCLSIESSIVLVQSIILTVHWLDVDTGWPVDAQDLELMGFTSWCCCFSLIRKKSSLFVSSLRRHLDPLSHIYIQFIKLIASRVATAQDGRTGLLCILLLGTSARRFLDPLLHNLDSQLGYSALWASWLTSNYHAFEQASEMSWDEVRDGVREEKLPNSSPLLQSIAQA